MITGPSSYVYTTQEFITHWTAVNAFLGGAGPLSLPNPVNPEDPMITLAMFTTERALLLEMRDAVDVADTERALARASLNTLREELHTEMNLFNEAVRGKVPQSIYARSLADVPGVEAGLESFTAPMKRTRTLWTKLNASPPAPLSAALVLKDGTTLVTFSDSLADLGTAWDAVTAAEVLVGLALEDRNDVQDVLYAWMKVYRTAARAALPAGSALLESLPRLTPEGGRTPDPVELNGGFDAVNNAADLDWTESTDEDLIEYEVRVTYGPDYDGENDHIVANIAKGQPRVLKTTKGLQVPGAVASYKVFVRIKGGGEAGSNAVAVERPA